MYIPAMGFITYILLAGYSIGVHGDFNPEQLGEYASGATGWLVLEVLVTLMVIFLLQVVNFYSLKSQASFSDSIRSRIPGYHRFCRLQIRPDHSCSYLWLIVEQPRSLSRGAYLRLRRSVCLLGEIAKSTRPVECCRCSRSICSRRHKKVCI